MNELPSASRPYLAALAAATAALGLRLLFHPTIGNDFPFLFTWPAVLFAAWYGGFWPGALVVALSAAHTIFFLLEPEHSAAVASPVDLTGTALFVMMGLGVSAMGERLRCARYRLQVAAAELAEEHEWLQVTLGSIGDAVIATGENGRVRFINQVAERLTGWPADQAAGRPLDELFRLLDESARQRVQYPVTRVLREGAVIGSANGTLLVARDGSEYPIEHSGAPIRDASGRIRGVVLVFMDCTARRRAVARLRETEERFRALVTAGSEAVYRMSPEWTEMRQLEGREFIADTCEPSRSWLEKYIPPDAQQLVLKTIDEAIRTKSFFELEHKVFRADGTVGWTFSRAIPLLDDTGEIVEWFGAAADVTRRKQAEEDLRALNVELEQRVDQRTRELSEANAQLEGFSYTIAHDLRAPLRNMHSLADILVEDYAAQLPGEARGYACRIVAAAHHMDSLIQDLLAYAKVSLDSIRLQAVDLDTTVADVLGAMASEIHQRDAQVRVCRPLGRVIAHPATLRQVLANLVENAIKFIEPGACPKVTLRAQPCGSAMRLYVADHGIGFDSEHCLRIFGVFERLHSQEAYPGTGIGLAIVRRGVERMGGKVGFKSQAGRGSRFWIELPKGEHHES